MKSFLRLTYDKRWIWRSSIRMEILQFLFSLDYMCNFINHDHNKHGYVVWDEHRTTTVLVS